MVDWFASWRDTPHFTLSSPAQAHLDALSARDARVQFAIDQALSTERHRIRTLLLEVAAKFGGPVGKALEEVAKVWEGGE